MPTKKAKTKAISGLIACRTPTAQKPRMNRRSKRPHVAENHRLGPYTRDFVSVSKRMFQEKIRTIRSPAPMVDPLHGFAFFTNAKCGGTTLKHWFLSSPRFHRMIQSRLSSARYFRTQSFSREFNLLRWDSRKYQMSPSDEAARRIISRCRRLNTQLGARPMHPGMPYFLVTRDPYARAVSAFVDKLCGEDRNLPWVRKVVDACGVQSPTFLDFIAYVKRTPDSETNAHWRRQTYIIDDIPDITMLRLEALQEDMSGHAGAWSDRDPEILSRKTQHNAYEATLDAGAAAGMTAEELVAYKERQGVFPRKDAFLSPEAKSLIRDAYEKDFARFMHLYP